MKQFFFWWFRKHEHLNSFRLFFFVAFLIQKHSFKTVPASVLAFNKCQTEGRLTLERGVTGQGRFLFVSLGSLLCCSLIFFMVWHTTRGKLLPSPHLLCYEAFRFSQGKNASWKQLFLRKLPSYSLQYKYNPNDLVSVRGS